MALRFSPVHIPVLGRSTLHPGWVPHTALWKPFMHSGLLGSEHLPSLKTYLHKIYVV